MLVQVWLIGPATARDALPGLLNLRDGLGKGVAGQMRRTVKNMGNLIPAHFPPLQKVGGTGSEISAAMTEGHEVDHLGFRVAGPSVNPLPIRQVFFSALSDAIKTIEQTPPAAAVFPTFSATLDAVDGPGGPRAPGVVAVVKNERRGGTLVSEMLDCMRAEAARETPDVPSLELC